MNGYVYILQSTKNNKYYIGSTNDLERRIGEHQSGKCHTTYRMLPIKLVFSQTYPDLKLARLVEYKLKKMKRRDIIEEIVLTQTIRMGP